MTISVIDTQNPAAFTARSALLPFYAAAGLDMILGLDLMLFGGWAANILLPGVAEVAGLDTAVAIRILGAVMLLFGLEVAAAAGIARLRRLLPIVVGMTWAGSAASLAAAAFWHQPLSAAGIAALLLIGVIAAGLAVAQGRALRGGDAG